MSLKKGDLLTGTPLEKLENLRTTNRNRQIAYLYVSIFVQREAMPRDPVCGAVLDEKTSKFKVKHEGETYYFCSVTCKKKFKRNPRKFAK